MFDIIDLCIVYFTYTISKRSTVFKHCLSYLSAAFAALLAPFQTKVMVSLTSL